MNTVYSTNSVTHIADTHPHDLIDAAISRQPHKLPPGISLIYDVTAQVHAYRMTSRLGSLSFPTDAIFDRCGYFPQEFSIFVSLKFESEPEPWKEECILAISASRTSKHRRAETQNQRYTFPNSVSGRVKYKNVSPKDRFGIHHANKKSKQGPKRKQNVRILSLSIKRGKLRFHYNRTFTWFSVFDLFDGDWHSIVVSVTGGSIVVTLDCRTKQQKRISRPFPAKLDVSRSDVFVGCCLNHRGSTSALVKDIILLPEADAAARACGIYGYMDEHQTHHSHTHFNVHGSLWKDPVPAPSQCRWTDVGYLTYDMDQGMAKVCVNGVWKALTHPVGKNRRVDYVTEHQDIRTPAPAIDVEVFTIPGQGIFAAFANSATNKKQESNRQSGGSNGNRSWKPRKHVNVKRSANIDRDKSHGSDMRNVGISYKIIATKLTDGTKPTTFIPKDKHNTNKTVRNKTNKQNGRHRSNVKGRRSNISGRSVIYKWQGSKFRFYQFVASDTAQCMKFFRVGTQYFLAVANFGFDTSTPTDSVIYKWDRKRRKFRPYQTISAWTARDFEFFSFDNNHYLAVANYAKQGSTSTDSVIYRWNRPSRRFEEFQRIATVGAYDWTYITVHGYHFLAVANAFNGLTTLLFSALYAWQTDRFVQFQTLETNGATDFEAFTIDDVTYIAVANAYNFGPQNYRNQQPHRTNSTIYRLDERKKQFVYFQTIPTNSAIDWEYFGLGSNHYLLLSNAQNEASSHVTSSIYRYKGLEGFVLTHELRTLPSADWEVFTHAHNTYLVYANARGKTSQVIKVIID